MKPTYRIKYKLDGKELLSGVRTKEDAEVVAEFMLRTGLADEAEVHDEESEAKDD